MSVWHSLASGLWSLASQVARQGVRRGYLKAVRLPVRVISVGNLQVGGSGKTPLVAHIAREALARGERVAVLSRGYGGSWEKPAACFCRAITLLCGLTPHSAVMSLRF